MSLETQAREAIVSISTRIFADLIAVLTEATQQSNNRDTIELLGELPLIKVLVPLIVTHLSPLVALNPKVRVSVYRHTPSGSLHLIFAIFNHFSECLPDNKIDRESLTTCVHH